MNLFKKIFGRQTEPIRHRDPKNVPGDFYVECNACILCGAPEAEAPDLIVMYDDGCYFKKQPVTAEEIDRAINAIAVSCIDAVHYGGADKKILEKIRDKGCRP
jgi:hypothetical protein